MMYLTIIGSIITYRCPAVTEIDPIFYSVNFILILFLYYQLEKHNYELDKGQNSQTEPKILVANVLSEIKANWWEQ